MMTRSQRNPSQEEANPESGRRIWTKTLSQEFWAGVATPLMFSLAGGLIEERMGRKGVRIAGLKRLENERFLETFFGRVYLNARILEEVVALIPSAFVTREVLRFLPEENRAALSRLRVPLCSVKTLRLLFLLFIVDRDWAPFSNYKAFEKAAVRVEGSGRATRLAGHEACSTSTLLEVSRKLYQEMGDFLDAVVWGMVFAYVARPLTELLAKQWGKDSQGELAACLRVGLDGVKTFEINREIEALAEEVAGDPWLNELFDRPDPQDILKSMRREEKAAMFLNRFEAFQKENGHRFHGRDICYPTWREQPETVIEMIRLHRGSDLCRRTLALQKEKRGQAERELKARIKKGLFGSLKNALFRLILSYDQKYFVIRENMRYYADIYLEQFRRVYLEIGRRWQSEGILEKPGDIVFLRKEEIEEACREGADILRTVEQRKKEYERNQRLRTPQEICDGDDSPFSICLPDPDKERFVLNGETASFGRVTGTARIVRSPEDILAFRKGDILVANCTDPSWTPVLSMAAGLVMEVGGLLSHGSIVAREFGIPALIQVEGAVERIRTGDRLELDTDRKSVRVVRGTPGA
jgi:phosphohistidine swiveling domain-containing protein